MLSADDIVRQSMQGKIEDPEHAVHGIAEYIKQNPHAFTVQVQNTLFVCIPQPDNGVEFHIFSIEKNPKKLAHQIVTLGAELKDTGYKSYYAETNDKAMLRIGEMTKLPAQVTEVTDKKGQRVHRWTMELN